MARWLVLSIVLIVVSILIAVIAKNDQEEMIRMVKDKLQLD